MRNGSAVQGVVGGGRRSGTASPKTLPDCSNHRQQLTSKELRRICIQRDETVLFLIHRKQDVIAVPSYELGNVLGRFQAVLCGNLAVYPCHSLASEACHLL